MTMNSYLLKRNLRLAFILLVIISIAFTAFFSYIQAMHGMNGILDDEMTHMTSVINYFFSQKTASTLQLARRYAQQPNIAYALMNKDRASLAGLTDPIYKQLNETDSISIFEFGDETGMVVYRAHNPGLFGDDKSANQSVSIALSGSELAGFDFGKSGLAIRAFVPVKINGTIVGTLQVGYNLNQHFLSEIQHMIDGDISFYDTDKLFLTTIQNQAVNSADQANEKGVFQSLMHKDQPLKLLTNGALDVYFPLFSPNGDTVQGMMSIQRSISTIHSLAIRIIIVSAITLAIFIIASIIISILISRKIHAEIRYISFHDKLTGLFNRAYLEEELQRLDCPKHYPLSILIGDVNGLKSANDFFGHSAGDCLLVQVSQILQKAVRKGDVLARWGGDEFALLLPNTDEKTAAEICDQISKAFEAAEDKPIKPSISVGYSTKSKAEQDVKRVMNEAGDRMYRRKLLEKKSSRSLFVSSLEKTMYERSCETQEHTGRLQKICIRIGPAIGLSDNEMDELVLLAMLHDIGKVGIKDKILMKPGKLTSNEWEEMKKHSEIGYRIAESCKELSHIAEYILQHHEKWDGSGYPLGLKGEEIPMLSTIITVADAYDVMTHSRPYRKNVMNHEDALLEILKCRGTQFSPRIADIFVSVMSKSNFRDAVLPLDTKIYPVADIPFAGVNPQPFAKLGS